MQTPAVRDLVFYSAAGVKVDERQPLLANTVYYAELGGAETMWDSIQWKHDDAIVITSIGIESTNLAHHKPEDTTASGGLDFWGGTRVWDTATGNWHPETAITAYSDAGGGLTTAYTTSLQHIGGNGAKRLRAKVTIGATGGKLRGIPHHKAG